MSGCSAPLPKPLGAEPVDMITGPLPDSPHPPSRPFPTLALAESWAPPPNAKDLSALQALVPRDAQVRVELSPELAASPWARGARHWLEGWGAWVGATEIVRTPLWSGGAPGEAPRISDDWWTEARAKPEPVALHLALEGGGGPPTDFSAESCEDLRAEFSAVTEVARSEAASFVAYADDLLWQVYRTQVEALLPSLKEEFRAYAEAPVGELEAPAIRCGRSYARLVARAEGCRHERAACSTAPRFDVVGGAAILAPASDVADVGLECSRVMGRHAPAELRDMAMEAAEVAVGVLEPAWIAWVERAAALAAIRDAVEVLCRPAGRRHSATDLEVARGELRALVERLSEPAHVDGHWVLYPMPGSDADAELLAEFASAPTSAAAQVSAGVAGWATRMAERGHCERGPDPFLLRATLVDVRGSVVRFDGRLFGEELRCDAWLPANGPA